MPDDKTKQELAAALKRINEAFARSISQWRTTPVPSLERQSWFPSFPFDFFTGFVITGLLAVLGIASTGQTWLYRPLAMTAALAGIFTIAEWVRRHNAKTNPHRVSFATGFGIGAALPVTVLVIAIALRHNSPAQPPLDVATHPVPVPPTVANLFDSDWRSCRGLVVGGDYLAAYAKGPKPGLSWMQVVHLAVCYDLKTDTKYVVFYVSPSPNPVAVIETLANNYADIVASTGSAVRGKYTESGSASEPLDTKGSRASDIVYVYHEDMLGYSQEDELIRSFRRHGAKAELRGPDYASAVYESMRAGDVTPLPSLPPYPVVDCIGRHYRTVHIAPNSTSGLICRQAMVATFPPKLGTK